MNLIIVLELGLFSFCGVTVPFHDVKDEMDVAHCCSIIICMSLCVEIIKIVYTLSFHYCMSMIAYVCFSNYTLNRKGQLHAHNHPMFSQHGMIPRSMIRNMHI